VPGAPLWRAAVAEVRTLMETKLAKK